MDSFQFGSPAVVGDDGEDDTDSDTLSADSGSGALDPTARVFDRSGRGIRAAQLYRYPGIRYCGQRYCGKGIVDNSTNKGIVGNCRNKDICGKN